MDVDSPEVTSEATSDVKGKMKDEHDYNKLLATIERCGVVITEVKNSEFQIARFTSFLGANFLTLRHAS